MEGDLFPARMGYIHIPYPRFVLNPIPWIGLIFDTKASSAVKRSSVALLPRLSPFAACFLLSGLYPERKCICGYLLLRIHVIHSGRGPMNQNLFFELYSIPRRLHLRPFVDIVILDVLACRGIPKIEEYHVTLISQWQQKLKNSKNSKNSKLQKFSGRSWNAE